MVNIKEGTLRIIDRKKNIFKLSQGEYIAPEKLENKYSLVSCHLDQLVVYGDTLKSNIIGIINLKEENKAQLMKQFNLEGEWNEGEVKKALLNAFN